MTEGAAEDKGVQYYRIRRRPLGREHLARSFITDFPVHA